MQVKLVVRNGDKAARSSRPAWPLWLPSAEPAPDRAPSTKSPWGTHRLLLARAAAPELALSILPCSLASICRLEERQLEENEVWAFAFSPRVLLFIIIYYEAALAHQ